MCMHTFEYKSEINNIVHIFIILVIGSVSVFASVIILVVNCGFWTHSLAKL